MDSKRNDQKIHAFVSTADNEKNVDALREQLDSLFHRYRNKYGDQAALEFAVAFLPSCERYLYDLIEEIEDLLDVRSQPHDFARGQNKSLNGSRGTK